MNEMNDPQRDIFTPGQRYVSLRAFSRLGSHFRVGERLTFKRVTFSHYDEIYCHEFLAEDGTVKIWFLLPNEQPTDWGKYFKPLPESATATPQPAAFRITVERGLAAHFKQANGPSRPGIDWLVKIEGPKSGTVIVRTYLKSAAASELDKAMLSQQALDLVQRKIESGWNPSIQSGILEVTD